MINKFRGDSSLFDDSVHMPERRAASPCLGMFPYADDIEVDAEDSLALGNRPRRAASPEYGG